MASTETPALNPEVYQHLRLAVDSRPLLEAAGLPLRRWESYCLAFMDPALVRGEKDRLEDPSSPRSVHPDVVRKVEQIRADIDPLVAKLRPMLPAAPASAERAELEEMMLGFIGGSPAARSAAARWLEAPDRHRDEAAHRLAAIEAFVTRYHRALKEDEARRLAPAPPSPAAPVPPPAPSDLRAEPGTGRVALRWSPVPGAAGYHVRRGELPLDPPARIATVTDPQFEDAAAEPGTPYQYAVSAFLDGAEGPACEPVHATARRAPPAPPANLRATATDGRIELTWEAVAGATDYLIRRRSGDAAPETVAHSAEPRWTDEAAPAGVEWTYDVLAVREGAESPPSNAGAARLDPPPPAPSALKAVGGPKQVRLEWPAVAGADGYVVLRAEEPSGPMTVVARVDVPSWTDGQVEDERTYYYSVHAVNRSGEGLPTAPASATPSSAPGVPALTGATGDREVAVRWAPVPGATSYR
ncbi:MAG TPA: hypothetical protein VEJ18_21365, partial [Planctomycetota bacterium]|nr:hypothetical protein [Planctomycetota bacterium]